MDHNINVKIQDHAWKNIYGWTKAADSEVSGLGLVKKDGDNFVVYDAFLLKQNCTSVSTELNPEEVSKLQYRLFKKKVPSEHLKFWWHTHYNFNPFWSGTDDNNAKKLAETNKQWELSLVLNQKAEYFMRLDVVSPVTLTIDNLEFEIEKTDKKERRNYKRDVQNNVKEEKWFPGIHGETDDGWVYDKKNKIYKHGDDAPAPSAFNDGGPYWWEKEYWANGKQKEEPVKEKPKVSKTRGGTSYVIIDGQVMSVKDYNDLMMGGN